MPIPKWITVLNKHVTNRFFLLFAGWIRPFAIVHHRGRRTGRSYRTPILAFPTETGFAFALPYGREVDWVKNLMSLDDGVLEYGGGEIPICKARIVKKGDVRNVFPLLVRIPLSIISIEDCVLVEASE